MNTACRWRCEATGGVTIGALISHGRYKPTEDGVSTRLAKGKADARIITLEADLAEVRMRSEYQTQMIVRLEDEIAFLRAQLTGLRAVVRWPPCTSLPAAAARRQPARPHSAREQVGQRPLPPVLRRSQTPAPRWPTQPESTASLLG